MTYKSYKSEVEKKLVDSGERSLMAVGMSMQRWSSKLSPVVTGRLASSVVWVTEHSLGDFEGWPEDKPFGNAEKDKMMVGTNVEYALAVDKGIGRKAKPFLSNLPSLYGATIKKIIETDFAKMMGEK